MTTDLLEIGFILFLLFPAWIIPLLGLFQEVKFFFLNVLLYFNLVNFETFKTHGGNLISYYAYFGHRSLDYSLYGLRLYGREVWIEKLKLWQEELELKQLEINLLEHPTCIYTIKNNICEISNIKDYAILGTKEVEFYFIKKEIERILNSYSPYWYDMSKPASYYANKNFSDSEITLQQSLNLELKYNKELK